MKIVATSDFHGFLPSSMPPCDILLLAGDYFAEGQLAWQLQRVERFREWLEYVPARHVVGIAGNHDWFLLDSSRKHLLPFKWTYLQDQAIEIEGLKIYGSPWSPPFYSWAFMQSEDKLTATFAKIPDDTDILITHGPPQGILDRSISGTECGSVALRQRVEQLSLKLHIFGHIHEAQGSEGIYHNVSRCTFSYKPLNPFMEFTL